MITVATTLPVVFERSVIRGHPPIETSPRPSATGSLHSAVGVLLNAGAVVVLVAGAVIGVARDELVLFAQTNLVPVFLHIYMTPFVFCVWPTLLHLPPVVAALTTDVEPANAAPAHTDAVTNTANQNFALFICHTQRELELELELDHALARAVHLTAGPSN